VPSRNLILPETDFPMFFTLITSAFSKKKIVMLKREVTLGFVEDGKKEATLTGVGPIILSLITLKLQTATG